MNVQQECATSLAVTLFTVRYNQEKFDIQIFSVLFRLRGFPSANLFTQPLDYSSLFKFKCNPL